jgi:hypothetical protein
MFTKKTNQTLKSPQGGQGARRWGPINFFCQKFYLYYLGAHAKKIIPMTTPSGRLSIELERKKRERKRKNAIYSGHLRLCQQPRAAHALRSDQNLNRNTVSKPAQYQMWPE